MGFDETEVPIALLVDAETGQVLFSRNSERRFVPASITKAMTLYTAFDLIADKKLDLRQSLVVRPETWREWRAKGSRMFLNAEERVPVASLLTGIATVSANDAAIVLAEGALGSVPAWTAQMNAKAREIGMTQSHFGTPNGWPDEGYTFTTARDLAVLGTALVRDHPRAFARFVGQPSFRYNRITQRNYDPLLGRVEGADGVKTGYTNEAGFGFLGTAKRGDRRLIVVVAGVDRSAVRARAARSLMEWGFDAFDQLRLFGETEVIGFARVQDGARRFVPLVSDGPITISVPRERAGDVRLSVIYDGPLRAPIAAREVVATLEIDAPGMDRVSVPLLARESVVKAGFLSRIANGIAGWFA
ncbi:MAG: D-alanyl-D-alanine carboxypeptidase family protein [Pseudomonadota bacterium]